MEQIKKILAPTDLSELSKIGVRYALQLAKGTGAKVTVYHVVDYDTLTRYGQRSMAAPHFQPPDEQISKGVIRIPDRLCHSIGQYSRESRLRHC